MIGVYGILLSLLLLMFLAYRGVSVIILAPLLALLAVIIAGESQTLLGVYTEIFMTGVVGFIKKYFPIFLLGAVFGKLMQDSGSARAIAQTILARLGKKHAALSIVLACAILTYGGVSAFVVAFAVYPLAAAMFREADMPKRFVPAAIALGAFTFTMTCLPGTAQIHNIIPTSYFGTTIYAAPVVGLVSGLVIMLLGLAWINRGIRANAGEGYGRGHSQEPEHAPDESLPGFWVAILPIVTVMVVSFVFTKFWLPQMDTSYLADPKFGAIPVSKVQGIWSMIVSLFVANIVVAVLNFRRFKSLNRSVTAGALGSMLPTFNTGSEVGYGVTIASLAAFAIVKQAVLNVAPGNPLLSEVVAVNVLAGITGSASGGLSIALEALGDTYFQLAQQYHIPLEWMHRLASMASGGFDTLPHNGAVITLLTICGLTHRQSYKDIAVVSLLIPVMVTLLVAFVLSLQF